jgi:hypothetical protein
VEDWQGVDGFHGYSVSNLGQVRNDDTGRVLTVLRNPHGTCYVGMVKGGKQYRRSLPQLVGNAFVPNVSGREDFNKLIHRDNDRSNNRADNLMWRPHWFAVKYLIQAKNGPWGSNFPVIEIRKQEIYQNSWDAALAFGLLERDLVMSILGRTFVWPTFQEFRYLAK